MKVLFLLLHPGYVRNYESVVRTLAQSGNHVHLAFSQPGKQSGDKIAERLAEELPRVSLGTAPPPGHGLWRNLAWAVRGLQDYSRYLDPEYDDAILLRARVADRVRRSSRNFDPVTARLTLALLSVLEPRRGRRLSRTLLRVLACIEAAIPPSRIALQYLREQRPDVVLITPLVNIASVQVDFLKAAKGLGVSNALCVASWDNLTNKGLIRVAPDAVLVWNEAQRDEAVRMHGMAAERVAVTGAQRFDEWFDQRPSRDRDAFCVEIGLDPAQPYLLYLCSSPFIAPQEAAFVERWLRELREEGPPAVAKAGVLIRLHPQNTGQWRDVDLSALPDVVIWPRNGPQPVDPNSRSDFWDSMYHAAAVVGINTSALIESAIAGKSVFTVRDPDFAGTQDGTLHFGHLLYEQGGPLHVADTMQAHLADLDRALQGGVDDAAHVQRFLQSFLRPAGLDQAATPLVVAEVERLLASPRQPDSVPPLTLVLRSILWPFVAVNNVIGMVARQRGRRAAVVRRVASTAARRPLSDVRQTGRSGTRVRKNRRRKNAVKRRLRRASRRPAFRWVARQVLPAGTRDTVRRRLRR